MKESNSSSSGIKVFNITNFSDWNNYGQRPVFVYAGNKTGMEQEQDRVLPRFVEQRLYSGPFQIKAGRFVK